MRKNTSWMDRQMNVTASQAGSRVAWMLRSIYRDCVDQRVANDLGDVDPRTVKGWLAGNCPNGTHLVRLCQHYGQAFTDFVMAGPSWVDDATFEAEMAASRVRIELLEQKFLKSEGRPNARLDRKSDV